MPPKKPTTAIPAVESSGGLLVSIKIVRAKLNLVLTQPSGSPRALSGDICPLTFASVAVTGDCEVVESKALPCNDDGFYEYDQVKELRRDPGVRTLNELINAAVQVRVHHAETKAVLATATIDLVNMGLDDEALIDQQTSLEPAEATNEGLKVGPGSVLTTSVSCYQLVPSAEEPADHVQEALSPSGTKAPPPKRPPSAPSTPPVTTSCQPYHFLSGYDATHGNVLELSITSVASPPEKLQSARDAAAGALRVSAGLRLPIGATPDTSGMTNAKGTEEGRDGVLGVVLSDGIISRKELTFSGTRRTYLGPSALTSLKESLESGQPLLLEVARYITPPSDSLADPAFDYYHGLLEVGASAALTAPGASEVLVVASQWLSFKGAKANGQINQSVLPNYSAPSGRARVIEEAPSSSEVPVSLTGWQAAGTRLQVHIRFYRPLYPPWEPPPKPLKALQDLIPRVEPKVLPAKTKAIDLFRAQVQDVAAKVLQYYDVLRHQESLSSPHETKGTPINALQWKMRLVQSMNKQGTYDQMKESLRAGALKVAREQYTSLDVSDAGALGKVCDSLYLTLLGQTRTALRDMHEEVKTKVEEANKKDPDKVAMQLKQWATECMLTDQEDRAEKLHQERVAVKPSAETWYDYGAFCLHIRALSRAEECFRSGLAQDPQHTSSLAALLCLLLHQAATTGDPGLLGTAEVLGHTMKDVLKEGDDTLAWSLLALTYRAMGKAKATEARNCHHEVVRRAKEAVEGLQGIQEDTNRLGSEQEGSSKSLTFACKANGYILACRHCLDLELPVPARQALMLAGLLKETSQWTAVASRAMEAEASAFLGQVESAVEGWNALRGETAYKEQVMRALAELHYRAGDYVTCEQCCRQIYDKGAENLRLNDFLRLGSCYMALGDVPSALNVYTEGCRICPCASLWLGAGVAMIKLEDLSGADRALCQANYLDPTSPLVWGYLLLVALRQGRTDEASQALRYVEKCELKDPAVLTELGLAYQQLGSYREAANMFRRVDGIQSLLQVKLLLMQSLLALKEYEAARKVQEAAWEMCSNDDQRNLVQASLEELQIKWPKLTDGLDQ